MTESGEEELGSQTSIIVKIVFQNRVSTSKIIRDYDLLLLLRSRVV